jgi:hypothetical protein
MQQNPSVKIIDKLMQPVRHTAREHLRAMQEQARRLLAILANEIKN